MKAEQIRFRKKPEGGLLVQYVKERIKKDKNWLAVITGPTGSGKTYSALALAEAIDPNFSAKNIVFTPEEFMQLLNGDTLSKGSVIVFDEAGVTLNARQWQQSSNQMIQHVLQTFRHKNYIVIFTAPHFGFIDRASRELFHCYMETQYIDFRSKKCALKPLMIQVAQRSGKMYFKYLRVILPKVGKVELKEVLIPLASKPILDLYEPKKTTFTSYINEKYEAEMTKDKTKEVKLSDEDTKFNKIAQLRALNELDNKKHKWEDIGDIYDTTGDAIRRWYSIRLSRTNREESRV